MQQVQQENKRLAEEQRRLKNDPVYLEKVAREKLGIAKEGEIILVLPDEETLYGYDIDPTLTRISLMNLMMHGITKPNIQQLNTLSKRYNEENTYDLILANPPFKGSIDESEMSDNLLIKTKKTELLFLELMFNSLASGGRCAVIVPDGVLFGNSNLLEAKMYLWYILLTLRVYI